MKDEQKAGTSRARLSSVPANSFPSDEFSFIERIRRSADRRQHAAGKQTSSLIPHPSSLLKGIGDDAAVFRANGQSEFCITTDLLVEEIDFRRTTTTPRFLGHKALAVSLSDIAAMGARPRFALLSVGVPRDVWRTKFPDEFYEGFFALADEHGVALIGGDVSRTPERIVIDSIVIGETKRGRAILRSGAQPGDLIYITGALGGAAGGLRLLEQGAPVPRSQTKRVKSGPREQLTLRQLRPTPRVAWGAWLGEQRLATAMLDLSDGLSSDLTHLCRESHTGAFIEASAVPVDAALRCLLLDGDQKLSLALNGGEDFELLFTVKPQRARRIPLEIEGVPATHIGVITKRTGLKLITHGRARSLQPAGFVHFD
ncbi:MAG: thiamine-phosphate kinase [Pyrinomonadaceae bacterium]